MFFCVCEAWLSLFTLLDMYELHFYWRWQVWGRTDEFSEKWMECVLTRRATHTWVLISHTHSSFPDFWSVSCCNRCFWVVTVSLDWPWAHRLWKAAGPSSTSSDAPCVSASCPEPSSPEPQKKKCGHITSVVVPVRNPTQMGSVLQHRTLRLRRRLFLRSAEGNRSSLVCGRNLSCRASLTCLSASCRLPAGVSCSHTG